jgi:hypothetical protein
MNLLSFGVGVHHVNNVIKSVGNLCGKTIDHFASVRTINIIGDQSCQYRISIVFFYIAKNMLSKFSCRRSVDIINNKF